MTEFETYRGAIMKNGQEGPIKNIPLDQVPPQIREGVAEAKKRHQRDYVKTIISPQGEKTTYLIMVDQPRSSAAEERKWGEKTPGAFYPQVETAGNPTWERKHPEANPDKSKGGGGTIVALVGIVGALGATYLLTDQTVATQAQAAREPTSTKEVKIVIDKAPSAAEFATLVPIKPTKINPTKSPTLEPNKSSIEINDEVHELFQISQDLLKTAGLNQWPKNAHVVITKNLNGIKKEFHFFVSNPKECFLALQTGDSVRLVGK